jgi:hypothetical protein
MTFIVQGFLVVCGVWSWRISFDIYRWWLTWVWIGILVCGQAALLLVSVDSSWRRLKPRQHIWVSLATAALLFGVLILAAVWSFLILAAVWSLFAGVVGDEAMDSRFYKTIGWWFGLWLLWGIVFFLYARRVPQWAARVSGWLLRGSVLDLIAVSCHVIVRHREDCCAPVFTGFGIATGMAIMLLSFGPSVLFLYKKRMKQYEK